MHDDFVVHGDHAIGLQGDAGSLSTGIERGHGACQPRDTVLIGRHPDANESGEVPAASFALILMTTADSSLAAEASRRTAIVGLLLPGTALIARLAITAVVLTALHNKAIAEATTRGISGPRSDVRRTAP